jgi:hypothetical protein
MAMNMRHGFYIGADLENLQMDWQLAGQPHVAAFLTGLQTNLDKIFRARIHAQHMQCHQNFIEVFGSGTDMAKPVDIAALVKKPPRRIELLGELLVCVSHIRPSSLGLKA